MTHKDLDSWKKAIDLVTEIYQLTRLFPDHERFGLSSQMQRSAVSIPSNIAEGSGRDSMKETIHFLYVSQGSLAELETQLIIAGKLKYLTNEKRDELLMVMEEIAKLIYGLINYYKKKLK
jgi:four helix bundle protein